MCRRGTSARSDHLQHDLTWWEGCLTSERQTRDSTPGCATATRSQPAEWTRCSPNPLRANMTSNGETGLRAGRPPCRNGAFAAEHRARTFEARSACRRPRSRSGTPPDSKPSRSPGLKSSWQQPIWLPGPNSSASASTPSRRAAKSPTFPAAGCRTSPHASPAAPDKLRARASLLSTFSSGRSLILFKSRSGARPLHHVRPLHILPTPDYKEALSNEKGRLIYSYSSAADM